jgi:hypothetical protein
VHECARAAIGLAHENAHEQLPRDLERKSPLELAGVR